MSIAVEESYKKGRLQYEARISWPDHSIHWFNVHGKVFYDEQNVPLRMYGTVVDILKQRNFEIGLEKLVGERIESLKEANRRLEKSVDQLKKSNEELESFNSIGRSLCEKL